MEERLKQVWVAAAAVESLQVEIDQAKAELKAAMDEALRAGADPEAVSGAAMLKPVDADHPVAPLTADPA
jgi:outer membrane murein-binding lipoprotein Lpp